MRMMPRSWFLQQSFQACTTFLLLSVHSRYGTHAFTASSSLSHNVVVANNRCVEVRTLASRITYVRSKRFPLQFETASNLIKTDVAMVTGQSDQPEPARGHRQHPGRSGLAQWALDMVLSSPLWKYVLVPQARAKIVQTAEENGIPFRQSLAWLQSQDGPWNDGEKSIRPYLQRRNVPMYYRKPFHAYEHGNLCWDAAMEVEIASCSVGARNFPAHGRNGEAAFRGAFDAVLKQELNATVPAGGTIVDMGCGTGMSTRRLAKNWREAGKILGIDLSPYFVLVGRRLLEMAPVDGLNDGGPWVSKIDVDDRIEYEVGDAAATLLPDESVDVVNIQFVIHELPADAARHVVDEAFRILKPGGQLWMCEMDFESPGFATQRANPLLFALIRSTEPYLDEYADSGPDLRRHVAHRFGTTVIAAATGRHFALVATKTNNNPHTTISGRMLDLRFNNDTIWTVQDTHLKVWENKLRS